MKDNHPDTEPAQFKQDKRKQIFFHLDVMDVVDYAECMSNKFELSENFLQYAR